MLKEPNENIVKKTKQTRLRQNFVDIHCHCLPGLDDGPATLADAMVLCAALADDGIRCVVATPHQLGRFDGRNGSARVRDAVCKLNTQIRKAGIQLDVLPGAEVRIDERVCKLLDEDNILTLADGGRYILLELPHETFIDIAPLLQQLVSLQVIPIISHAERYDILAVQPNIVPKWLDIGAHLQVTACSLTGHLGQQAKKVGWRLLTSRYVSVIATDAHDTNQRCPMMTAAFDKISLKLGADAARLLTIENPTRIINGEDLMPVPLLEHKQVRQ